MNKLKVNNISLISPPSSGDVGYDIFANSEPNIVGKCNESSGYTHIDYIEYETNLYTHPATEAIDSCQSSYSIYNCHTDLRPRSSISKYNIVLANSVGLIDRGYRNQILVRFKYIWQPEDYSIIDDLILGTPNLSKLYNMGDKICQLLPMETHDIEFHPVDILDNNDRGGGFGSTGK
jgi:dUTP pyrophosphatase